MDKTSIKDAALSWITQDKGSSFDAYFTPYSGSALLVPMIHWLREASTRTTNGDVIKFYKMVFEPILGPLQDMNEQTQAQVIDYSFHQLVYKSEIEPLAKQGLLAFDNVFLISEYDAGEDVAELQDLSDERLRPGLAKGIRNPDIIMLPMHFMIGFLARVMTVFDNKDRCLRMPGWKTEQNLAHLKNVNHSFNELTFLQWTNEGNGAFSLVMPNDFERVVKRKALSYIDGFRGSPSVQLLFPDLDNVPWDEVVDIARTSECRDLKAMLLEWDSTLRDDKGADWCYLGKRLRPLIDALTNELEKAKVSRTRAWVNMLVSLLPQPIGAAPSAVDLVKAYRNGRIASALTKAKRLEKGHRPAAPRRENGT